MRNQEEKIKEIEIYCQKTFIGREKEINLFKKMLDDPIGEKWILNIIGEGGIGKTLLMKRFIEILEEVKKRGKNYLFTIRHKRYV